MSISRVNKRVFVASLNPQKLLCIKCTLKFSICLPAKQIMLSLIPIQDMQSEDFFKFFNIKLHI